MHLKTLAVFALGILFTLPNAASAGIIIEVDVIDTTTIHLDFSGTVEGPTPSTGVAGQLFIDTPVRTDLYSGSTSITGDAVLGSNSLTKVYSGYASGGLQLRAGINSNTNLLYVGDLVSGAATVVFNIAHEMTQDMFDGQGLPIYWGSSNGTLQGYATSAESRVPAPSILALISLGLAGIGYSRRNQIKAE